MWKQASTCELSDRVRGYIRTKQSLFIQSSIANLLGWTRVWSISLLGLLEQFRQRQEFKASSDEASF